MSQVELYSYDACPFAQRTRMVLNEKGIDYQLHEVDVYDKPAGWEQISPYGKVPLLRHAGGTVYESAIINEYLDEAFPEPPLMPAGPLARAQARIWIDYCESRFLPATHALMRERDDPQRQASNLDKVHEVLRFMEHEGMAKLGQGPYWFDDRPTLVDFQYLPFFERFAVYEAMAGFRWPADCPRLRHWFDTMSARPAVAATLRPVEFHLEQQRRLAERIAQRRAASA
jgi:glutathione S-transferase